MKESAWNDEADRRSSEWLDTDVMEGQSSAEPASLLDERAQIRAADLQLIDAMLSNISSHAVNKRSDRIRRVIEAIEGDQASLESPHRFRRWQSVLAIAASMMVAFGLLWTQFSQDTRATEVLRELGQVAMEKTDRIYHLRRDVPSSNAPQQLDGQLYLRGRDGFVLRCGTVVLGRNADECWLVAKDEVVVAESFEWMVAESERGKIELELLKELSADSRKVPLMHLSSVIELMQHDYDVTLRRDARHQDQQVDEIVGTLRDTPSTFPDRISLWSGTDSRIIRRAELSWGRNNTLVFELAPTGQVPADWYHHEAHHAGEQPVRRIPHDW